MIIRKCTIDDLPVLQDISRSTYKHTFASMNTEDDMNAYLDDAFNTEKLKNELLNEPSFFYFVYADDRLAGYLKLNESDAQTDIHDSSSLELERIYVLGGFQGKGVGRFLMNKAISVASERNKAYIWLGVWEKNESALAFYKKNGFYPMGTHAFVMGNDVQTDYLMRKDI
ncbi:MAG: GNAT family N-acetyltransferase [Clostridia bacterium]|nr:GNAT family N-acetyltransferase [Clostridia bacterium]